MNTGVGQLIPFALYAVIMCASLLSIIWKPQLGIYVLAPILPYQTLRAKLEDFPLGSHLVFFVLLCVVAGLFIKSKASIPKTPLNKVLVVLAIFLYLSLWQGSLYLSAPFPLLPSDPRFSVWKDYMSMPLLFVATLGAIQTTKQMKIVVVLVCLSILLVDRGAVLNIATHNLSSHYDENKRDGGPLGYAGSNGLAAFEAQCCCFLLGFVAYEQNKMRKVAIYALFALTLYCLLYAFSRGGYLSFLTGLLVLAILKNRKLFLVIALLLFAWQTIVPAAVQERINMTYNQDAGLEESADERVQLWTDAVQLVHDNPVFGTGYVTYMYMGRVGRLKDTHNIYMKVLVETGAVGMLLFVLVLAKCFSVAARLRRVAEDPFANGLALGLLSLLGCLVIVNIFGDRWTYIEINGVVWILLAIAARAYSIQTERESEVAATAEEELSLPERQLDPEEAAWLEWQHRRAEAVPEI